MDLDEMKTKWAEYDRKLEASLRLNRAILSEARLNHTRSALQRLAAFAALEMAMWIWWMVVLGGFVYRHTAMRFAMPAVILDLYALGNVIALARQIAAAHGIDYGEPVTAIQKRIERLRFERIRRLQMDVLAGTLIWVPLLIVALKGFFDVDAFRIFDATWMAANVGFGMALIPLSIWLSKKYGDRMSRHPILQRLMQDLAGHNLNTARRVLADLSEFEQDCGAGL